LGYFHIQVTGEGSRVSFLIKKGAPPKKYAHT